MNRSSVAGAAAGAAVAATGAAGGGAAGCGAQAATTATSAMTIAAGAAPRDTSQPPTGARRPGKRSRGRPPDRGGNRPHRPAHRGELPHVPQTSRTSPVNLVGESCAPRSRPRPGRRHSTSAARKVSHAPPRCPAPSVCPVTLASTPTPAPYPPAPAAPRRTLLDVLAETAARHPGEDAIDAADATLTYRRLAEEVDAVRRRLADDGIGVGDRVGVRVSSGT